MDLEDTVLRRYPVTEGQILCESTSVMSLDLSDSRGREVDGGCWGRGMGVCVSRGQNVSSWSAQGQG